MSVCDLRPMWIAVVAAVATAALGIAGCGSAGDGGGSLTPAARRNFGEAQAQSTRLLAMLKLPPGAVRSSGDPSADAGALAEPGMAEVTPNLVDAHAWWTIRESPAAVLAYVSAHLPAGAGATGSESGNSPRGFAEESFSLPPVPGVLSQRMIAITVVPVTSTTTAVRTDGEAIWLTPRPKWERIPASVTSVRFTAIGESSDGRSGPRSVLETLTGQAARRLVAFINSLGVVQPGTTSCPAAFFDQVDLRFYDGNGTEVAHAVENPTGCAFVRLSIGSRTGPSLSDYPPVTQELEHINTIKLCTSSALVATPAQYAPPGSDQISFSFSNRSDSVCRVSGYPKTWLIDAQGQAMRTGVRHQSDQYPPPTSVQRDVPLDPGQSAVFWVSFQRCHAPRAAVTRIELPQVAKAFALRVGSAKHPFAPCDGRLRVGALEPGV